MSVWSSSQDVAGVSVTQAKPKRATIIWLGHRNGQLRWSLPRLVALGTFGTLKSASDYLSPWYNRNGWLGVKHQVTATSDYLHYTIKVGLGNSHAELRSAMHKLAVPEFRSCVNWEVGLGSHSLSLSSPVPKKPYGFCGRKAPWKKKQLAKSFFVA